MIHLLGFGKRAGSLFSYADLGARVRADHPWRVIREVRSAALVGFSGDLAIFFTHPGWVCRRSRRNGC
jgi:hypothetical protein